MPFDVWSQAIFPLPTKTTNLMLIKLHSESVIVRNICQSYVKIKYMDLCWSTKIPKSWQQAEVKPIFKKKGGKTNPGNYRPVSLTLYVKSLKALSRIHRIIILQRINCLYTNSMPLLLHLVGHASLNF